MYRNLYNRLIRIANTPVRLSHYTAITRSWRGDVKFLRAPWDRRKKSENLCILFSIFTPWRCYGVPTAIVAFLRSFHGVLSRSCGVLVGDRLRAHGVLTACSRRATACTPRFRSGHRARTALAGSHKFPAILLRLEDTGYALVLVLIDEGLGRLAHTNTHRHGIVRDSQVKLHAGVPVPGGDIKITRQNATYDRLELSYLVS